MNKKCKILCLLVGFLVIKWYDYDKKKWAIY